MGDSYIPAVAVVPRDLTAAFRARPRQFEAYVEPLPLVVEIWSLSTGNYDIDRKIPVYQLRSDQEIWRVHPFECVVTAWRRQPNGSYVEASAREGVLALHALAGVSIDIDQLFRTD